MSKRIINSIRVFLLFGFMFMNINSFAQPKKADEIKEYVWGENDKYKQIPVIPEKWNNESVVIVLDQHDHSYSKFTPVFSNSFAGIRVREHYITRRILKLNDKAAVEEFSELEFTEAMKNQGIFNANKDKKFLGLRIIKPNGNTNEIDVENEKIKISNSDSNQDEYKIAIADLEPGDIIDYYVCTIDSWETNATTFDPIETTLNDDYPIMDFLINLRLGNDFFINYNSYNGAPELKDISKDEGKEKEYKLHVKNIDKREVNRWVYPLVEYPSFKYQIAFARSDKRRKEVNAFLSKNDDRTKRKVNVDDVLDSFKDTYELDMTRKAMKKYFKDKPLSKKEIAEQAYYFMRHVYLNQYIESVVAYEEKLCEQVYVYNDPLVITKSKQFLQYFGSFLKSLEIPFDFITTKRRYDGSIEDLLIKNNLATIIKVNLEEPMYFYPFKSNTFADWFPSTMEGTEGYALKFSDKYDEVENIEKIQLPTSTYQDNHTTEVSTITFDEEFSTITVDRKSSLIGHNKVNQMGDRLYFFDYINSEYSKFGTNPYADLLSKKNKKVYDERLVAYKEKMSKKRLERLEEYTQGEYDFKIEDFKFEVESPARYSVKDSLIYNETFLIKDDLIKKAGPNFILEVGKLIGSQVAIEEKEKSRTENIYMTYPRSFNNEININIPDGYTISGYDKLNQKTENETGGFVSEASLEGNMLKVKTYKYYKNNYEPNSNWGKMLEFLEVAYQFSQEKVLLKKK